MKAVHWSVQSLEASTLEELQNQITVNAARLLNSPLGVLLLIKDDYLNIEAITGIAWKRIETKRIPIGKSISGQLIKRGTPRLITDMGREIKSGNKNLEPYYRGSLASCPLIFNKELIGMINIARHASHEPLTQENLLLLISYCSQAAFAITSQRLVDERTAKLKKTQQKLLKANQRLKADIIKRKRTEKALLQERNKLHQALSQVKTLKGLLPICSNCKKIRDDKGYWNQIESYVQKHSEVDFSHSICPKCAETLYPDISYSD